jgi:glutaminyl-peptide cyclotransferase
VRFALVLSVIALVLAGPACGASTPESRGSSRGLDRFDASRAWRLAALQVAVGQRPAGSPQLRALAVRLRPLLPDGHFEPVPGEPRLRNVVGTLKGRKPGIVIGAHYDTLTSPPGFVGANNGAAGSAVVIEASRALRRLRRPRGAREVRFVLFDGEEPAAGLPEDTGDFYHQGLRGSRGYVARHPKRTKAMVLLDYVGNKGLSLPREGSSSQSLWTKLRAAARRAGALAVFPDQIGDTITDDHSPFLNAGVPAIDLIDWSYPGHDVSDRMDKLSRRSLNAVGETVVELANELRRR